jgi:hypothetical protein
MSWIFFGPAMLIAHWAYAGITIAATLIVSQMLLTIWNRGKFDKSFFREAPVFAGLLWLIFGFYEMQMRAATATTGKPFEITSFFRLDLIVLVPILYLMTGAAIYSITQQVQRNRRNGR